MADKIFIETRKKFNLDEVNFEELDGLNGTISLAATIQYLDLLKPIKKYLEKKGNNVLIKKGAYYQGHVIGCNPAAFNPQADLFLLLADGKFHALNNAIQLQKPIYIFNTKKLEEFTQEEINEYNKKIKGKVNKFLHSDNVGILVSTKKGQNYNSINKLKQKISKQKNCYVFESDNINLNEFENFPQINMWVNTACYGLSRDHSKIVNLKDILAFI